MKFTKMHGCGNDYVYADCRAQPAPADPAAVARAVSDRHYGIGADGLILILPSGTADVRMRMFNADGSEGEMCGNGIRCVAKFVYDRGMPRKSPIHVETARGVLRLDLETTGGRVDRVRVDMGEPILESARVPTTIPSDRVIDYPLPPDLGGTDHAWFRDCGLDPRMTCVSMGNPHVVLFCWDVAKVPLAAIAPFIERAGWFPKRINVHFVQLLHPGEVIMRTWERGSGATLACGTGACAVTVAGALTDRTGRCVLAHLPGGDLNLDWSESDNHVYMTGPAVEVFSGEWPDKPDGLGA
jgi:diaminopimelate epimerase